RLFRPVITLDEFTGAPKLSLDISRPPELERTLPQLFQFLDAQSQKTCIAIDEFQQILNYPEKNTEALLRTAMQQMKNVVLIFCGRDSTELRELVSHTGSAVFASNAVQRIVKVNGGECARFIAR